MKGKVKREMPFKRTKLQSTVYRCKFCNKNFPKMKGLIMHVTLSYSCISNAVKKFNEDQLLHEKEMNYKRTKEELDAEKRATTVSDTFFIDQKQERIPIDVSGESETVPEVITIEDNENILENKSESYINALHAETKLMKILHDANAPNYLYHKIIDWLQEVNESNVAIKDISKTRKSVLHKLEKLKPDAKENRPYQIKTFYQQNQNLNWLVSPCLISRSNCCHS
jgi:hypothetical protein